MGVESRRRRPRQRHLTIGEVYVRLANSFSRLITATSPVYKFKTIKLKLLSEFNNTTHQERKSRKNELICTTSK